MMDLHEKVSDAFWCFCGVTGVTAGVLSPPVFLPGFPHDSADMLHSLHHSLLTAHLSHLGPTASLVLQWVTLLVQAAEGWCVLCMPKVWICCDNFSELALFLLCPFYSNALLLGWSCSWWMDFLSWSNRLQCVKNRITVSRNRHFLCAGYTVSWN